ncbi:hypothetical protein BGZ63DRAFT_398860 [Mariannaea sp. PMI_226]|nr:hypothetical protein BGZ63DRAFT_398860 [Mariannaea sp. PMI_226]
MSRFASVTPMTLGAIFEIERHKDSDLKIAVFEAALKSEKTRCFSQGTSSSCAVRTVNGKPFFSPYLLLKASRSTPLVHPIGNVSKPTFVGDAEQARLLGGRGSLHKEWMSNYEQRMANMEGKKDAEEYCQLSPATNVEAMYEDGSSTQFTTLRPAPLEGAACMIEFSPKILWSYLLSLRMSPVTSCTVFGTAHDDDANPHHATVITKRRASECKSQTPVAFRTDAALNLRLATAFVHRAAALSLDEVLYPAARTGTARIEDTP